MNGSRRTIADSRETNTNPRFTASFFYLSINIYLDILEAIIPVRIKKRKVKKGGIHDIQVPSVFLR